jgi:hypothetical protein
MPKDHRKKERKHGRSRRDTDLSEEAEEFDEQLGSLEFRESRRASHSSAVNMLDNLINGGDFSQYRQQRAANAGRSKSPGKMESIYAAPDQSAYEQMLRGTAAPPKYQPYSSAISPETEPEEPEPRGRRKSWWRFSKDLLQDEPPQKPRAGQPPCDGGDEGGEANYGDEDNYHDYKQQRRARQGKAERETDLELAKKQRRAFGQRPKWHPMGWIESAGRATLLVVGGTLVMGLLVALLMTWIFWPRAVHLDFVSVEHDSNPKPYLLLPQSHTVHLRVNSWITVALRNPNFSPALVKRSQVTLWWERKDGRREMFGGTVIDEEAELARRGDLEWKLPVTIEYEGNPKDDPIYEDFVDRCFNDQQPEAAEHGDGRIYLVFEVEVTTEAREKERVGRIEVTRSMMCPMGPKQIQEAFDTLFAE